MKYIKLFENVVFNHTIYCIPTKEELSKFNETNLTPKEIFNEIFYTIIGRGVLSIANKDMIVKSAEVLVNNFNDDRYIKVLEMAKNLKPIFK